MSVPATILSRTRIVCAALIATATAAVGMPAFASGTVGPASSAPVTEFACFGAPARSPVARCVDPNLQRTIYPAPEDAPLTPNAACLPMSPDGVLRPCSFGDWKSPRSDTIALIGDSHAGHWRAAVDVVARAHDRRAVSQTRSGCAFTTARVIIPADRAAGCRAWGRQLLAWLGQRPEISTVFLSTRARARYVRSGGASNFETAVEGHLALWRALPATVEHVFVIRDTPYSSYAAGDCVRRAYARRRPAAAARCARPRAQALRRDPAVTAARRLRSPRIHVIDMTPFFCDDARCYQVVGGALVYKDAEHITSTFARTLGPFMDRRVAAVS
jgi:hypothetical protein